jgi:hypothetical protein
VKNPLPIRPTATARKHLARGHNRDHGQLRLRHRTRAAAAARHDHAEPGSRRGYGPRRVAHGYKLAVSVVRRRGSARCSRRRRPRRWHRSGMRCPASALPMPRMRRVISNSNTMVTTHNAWRRGDIHQRNIADRRRDMRRLRDILQRQAMDRHQAIRAAQPAMT